MTKRNKYASSCEINCCTLAFGVLRFATMTPIYTPPETPADPADAALELFVRLPTDLLGYGHRSRLQDFAGALHIEDVFAGLSWWDAKPAAFAICADMLCGDPDAAAELMRFRALSAIGASERWDAPRSVSRAFALAARLVEL